MAYAAALDDLLPCYMDTRDEKNFVAHPLFPVCFEWPVVVALGRQYDRSGLRADEVARGVHATHDLIVHRPIRPPERLITRATVAGIERRKPGAYQVLRLDTVDSSGAPVATSYYGSIFRGVDVEGSDNPASIQNAPAKPSRIDSKPCSESVVAIGGGLAHTYTECARIYNPIHTDIKVAQAAGLPGLILHGTATLALAVSRVVAIEAGGDPTCVARVAGRFNAMVLVGTKIRVRILTREVHGDADFVFFDVLNQDDAPAISDGVVGLRR